MGAIHVTVAIRNLAEPERVWEGLFLVDTGATDCLVPRQHLESIGLTPRGQRRYGLADGSETTLEVTGGQIEFMGETTWGTIVFGEETAEPPLGVAALESVGIEVHPRNQTLPPASGGWAQVSRSKSAVRDARLSDRLIWREIRDSAALRPITTGIAAGPKPAVAKTVPTPL